MSDDLSAPLAGLLRGVRDGRAALLMDADGMVVAATGEAATAESIAGEYGALFREAQDLAAARGWGSLGSLTVRGGRQCLAFARVPGELVLGLTGGPEALAGQLRRAVTLAAPGFGEL
jgi:predicted regulator of Ras-like GTPase activity (Roadblock/LC7/MglB family)